MCMTPPRMVGLEILWMEISEGQLQDPGTVDSGIGDSLSGAEVFWMGVVGMSSWVA